jgi:SAM-dependent methyltransferase
VSQSEFDAYASGYTGGHENRVKAMLGKGLDDFVEIKAEWLLRDLRSLVSADELGSLLDFGCGTGVLLRVLRRLGYEGALEGCDVSRRMLAEARSTWPGGPIPPMHQMVEGRCERPDASFDVIVSSGVFHHIPRSERAESYDELVRLTKPGGRIYIFEHNPYNPLTRWVVNRTRIDADAVLLAPREVREGLSMAGAVELETDYLMFLPPRWRRFRGVDRFLRRVPMGGQYVISARPAN